MKKLALVASCLLAASSTFAAIKVGGTPDQPYNGKDYVGKIVAAEYTQDNNGQQHVLIITTSDDKNNESKLKSLTIEVDGNDVPYGLTLAASVGKKVAVLFTDADYDISMVQIITDEYWNGNAKKK